MINIIQITTGMVFFVGSTAKSLYYPLLLTEWTAIVLLYPQLHATVVK